MDDTKKDSKTSPQIIDDMFSGFVRDSDTKSSKTRLTPAERVKMIERAFEDVLNRKPDTRDLNFYKYSSLSEEEVTQELLEGKEHKALLEDGREFRKVRASLETAQTRIKVLESEIQDQNKSFEELNKLLKEKNTHIVELREQLKSPFDNRCPSCQDEKGEKTKEESKEEVNEMDFKLPKFIEKLISIFS